MFCFPEGIKNKKQNEMPKSLSFIITDQFGKRHFATCLIITEEITESLQLSFVPTYLTEEKLYIEKGLCLIGKYPFFNNYKKFLKELYRIQVSFQIDRPLEVIVFCNK